MPGSKKAPLRASLAAVAVVLAALAATFVVVGDVGDLQRERDARDLALSSTVAGWADAADRILAGTGPLTGSLDSMLAGDADATTVAAPNGEGTGISLVVLDDTGVAVSGSSSITALLAQSSPRPARAGITQSGALADGRSYSARGFGPNGGWTIIAIADDAALVKAEDRPQVLALKWVAITAALAAALLFLLRPADRRFRSIYDHATCDVITGLANRASITTTLRRQLGGTSPVVVAIIDLDDFKPVNDTWGHRIGDEALRTVGDRLARFASDHDMLVGRLGGDEFLVVAPHDSDRAWENLVDTMAVPFAVRDLEIRIGASVGVVRVGAGDIRTLEHVLSVADRALYRIKSMGGNGWQRQDDPLDVRAGREPTGVRGVRPTAGGDGEEGVGRASTVV